MISANGYAWLRHTFFGLVVLTCAAGQWHAEVPPPQEKRPADDGLLVRIGAKRWTQKGTISHLAWVVDLPALAAVSDADGVVFWNPTTGQRLKQVTLARKERMHTLSADGRVAAYQVGGNTMHFDDLPSGKPLARVQLPHSSLAFAALSGDGSRFAACTSDKDRIDVTVWETAGGKRLWYTENVFGPLAFGAGSKTLLIGGLHRVRIWDIASGKEIERLESPARELALSTDQRTLATFGDETVTVWDLPTGTKRHHFAAKAGKGDERHLLVSADGQTVAFAGMEGLIVWKAASAKMSRSEEFRDLALATLSSDGKTLYWASGGVIGRWDVAVGRDPDGELGPARSVQTLQFLDGDRTLATADISGRVQFWDTATARAKADMPRLKIAKFESFFEAILSRRLTAALNGKVFALQHEDGTLQIRAGNDGRLLKNLGKLGTCPVAFSRDGTLLAVAEATGADGQMVGRIVLWDTATGNPVRTLAALSETYYSLAFAADGKTLYSAGDALRAWDVSTGQIARRLINKNCYDLADAGSRLVGVQQSPVVWDAVSGREVYRLSGWINLHCAVSPDGTLLATGDENGLVRLHDLEKGQPLGEFNAHAAAIGCLTFSSDGKRLASSADDLSIKVWDVAVLLQRVTRPPERPKDLAPLWEDLASADAALAFRAVWTLAGQPKEALALIAERLAAVKPAIEANKLDAVIRQLDAAEFARRQEASTALAKLGTAAVPAMVTALKAKGVSQEQRQRLENLLGRFQLDGPLVPEGPSLRAVRVIEVLERIGNAVARKVLKTLSDDSDPWTARHARAALERLAVRDKTGQAVGPVKAQETDPLPAGAVARFGSARLRHGGYGDSLVFSPDGQLLSTGGHGWKVRVWQTEDGKPVWTSHSQTRKTAFSPDGSWLAIPGRGEIVFADLKAGKEAWKLENTGRLLDHLAFSPDGRFLTTVDVSGYVILWDLKEKRAAKEFHAAVEGTPVGDFSGDGAFALSLDGRWVAVVARGAKLTVAVYDVWTGKAVLNFTSKSRRSKDLAFSSDGRRLGLLTEGLDSTVEIFDLATGKLAASTTVMGHFWHLALAGDGRTVALGSPVEYVLLWDAATGQLRMPPHDGNRDVEGIALSPDGRFLAVGEYHGVVRLLDAHTLNDLTPAGLAGRAHPLGFVDDGRTLLIQAGDWLHCCDVVAPKGETAWQILEKRRLPVSMDAVLSPDGKRFLDRTWFHLSLWDTTRGVEHGQIRLHNGYRGAALGNDRVAVMTGGKIAVHDAVTGKRLHSFTTFAQVEHWVLSPDGKTVLVTTRDDSSKLRIDLFDLASGLRLHALQLEERCSFGYEHPPLTSSPDGSVLVVASEDNVLIVDVKRSVVLRKLPRHSAGALAPDGKTLAVGDVEGVVRLYDVGSAKMLVAWPGHSGPVVGLRWSPDGRLVASGSSDGTVLLWDAAKIKR